MKKKSIPEIVKPLMDKRREERLSKAAKKGWETRKNKKFVEDYNGTIFANNKALSEALNTMEIREAVEEKPFLKAGAGRKIWFIEQESLNINQDVVMKNVKREYNVFLYGIRMVSAFSYLSESARVRVRLTLINMGNFRGWCELVSIKYLRWCDIHHRDLIDSVYEGQVNVGLKAKELYMASEGKSRGFIDRKEICTVVRFKFLTDENLKEEGWERIVPKG
jgi:hypothetical protein